VLQLRAIRIIDVSPGPMLFRELENESPFQRRICLDTRQYLSRLDHFVAKYQGGTPPGNYDVTSDKIAIIPNGVSAPRPCDRPLVTTEYWPSCIDSERMVGTCGRIVPSKHVEFLIEMMRLLTERVPGVSLTVVGGVERDHIPYWNTLVDQIRRAGLTNIFFVGSHVEVNCFLQRFKVFVMVSDEQGCPNASLEAMAMGLPVVANPNGGTAEQICHGVNGFLVSDRDPSDMAAHVELLLTDPTRAAAFGEASREVARRKFSMERMVEQYLRILAS